MVFMLPVEAIKKIASKKGVAQVCELWNYCKVFVDSLDPEVDGKSYLEALETVTHLQFCEIYEELLSV